MITLTIKPTKGLRGPTSDFDGTMTFEVAGPPNSVSLWLQTSVLDADGKRTSGSCVQVKIGPKGGISAV